MVYVSWHWSKHGADNFALWYFAVKNAVWLHNFIPNHLFGLKLMELFTKTKVNHCDLLHTHVWRCPVYLHHYKLLDGQETP